MTTTTDKNGRFCNQIFRNLAVSFIAEKFDLQVSYANFEKIQSLGIDLYNGTNVYKDTIQLNDNNFFDILNMEKLNSNLEANNAYFQTKEIGDMIYNHLRQNQKNIEGKNPFKDRYNNNNDCFIHLRVGNCGIPFKTMDPNLSVGHEYYIQVLSKLNFDKLYISTDNPNNSVLQKIQTYYPTAIILNYDEVKTIQFGSTCKNIILSHGTFSVIIGYIGFYSNIFYPNYSRAPRKWFSDLFTIGTWNKV
jgi:hypothetical protein